MLWYLLCCQFLITTCISEDLNGGPGIPFKLQLKAWVAKATAPTTTMTAAPAKKKLPSLTMRIRAVHQERHIVYTKKDESLEEILPDKKPVGNGFETVELRPPEDESDATLSTEDTESAEETQTAELSTTPEPIMVEILDDSGRVGPMFEVRDEILFRPPAPLPDLTITHGHFDTALLEKETMIRVPVYGSKQTKPPKHSKSSTKPTKEHDETEKRIEPSAEEEEMNMEELRVLREKLRNSTNLEASGGDRHRDYGSSFILPILSSINYDNNTVPTAFSDIPVIVAVQLNILYLANFDSELMEYSIDIEMSLSWYDLRLANNYTKPIRIREKQILDLIWKPDPYFVNSKFSHFHKVSFPNFRMRVYPDGLVKYTMRVTSVCSCFMLFCLYPHDRQTCDLQISSIAYPSSFLQFAWHSTPVKFQSEITLPELHVQRIRTEQCHVEGKLIHSSCIRLVFELERDGGRFIVEKYIPSTLAMMFAWVAPYVPYNYEEVRIITPITVLLTLVQMEKGDKEIRTSYLTSIDIWFAAMKSFTALSIVESLIVLALIKRSRSMERYMHKAANELQRANYQSEKYKLTRLYHRLDSVSRFLSPVVFVMFFMYYVVFIAQGSDRDCVSKLND